MALYKSIYLLTYLLFLRYSTLNNSVPLKYALGVINVSENGIIQQTMYGFLFVFYSNYDCNLHYLRDIGDY